MKEQNRLVDLAIRQIITDLAYGDHTALSELLEALPPAVLKNFIGNDLDEEVERLNNCNLIE